MTRCANFGMLVTALEDGDSQIVYDGAELTQDEQEVLSAYLGALPASVQMIEILGFQLTHPRLLQTLIDTAQHSQLQDLYVWVHDQIQVAIQTHLDRRRRTTHSFLAVIQAYKNLHHLIDTHPKNTKSIEKKVAHETPFAELLRASFALHERAVANAAAEEEVDYAQQQLDTIGSKLMRALSYDVLDLRNCHLDDTDWIRFVEFVEENKYPAGLLLDDSNITDEALEMLTYWGGMDFLKTLSLNNVPMRQETANSLLQSLVSHKSLSRLSLRNCGLTLYSLRAISNLLRAGHLQYLDLRNNTFPQYTLKRLGDAIRSTASLIEANLGDNSQPSAEPLIQDLLKAITALRGRLASATADSLAALQAEFNELRLLTEPFKESGVHSAALAQATQELSMCDEQLLTLVCKLSLQAQPVEPQPAASPTTPSTEDEARDPAQSLVKNDPPPPQTKLSDVTNKLLDLIWDEEKHIRYKAEQPIPKRCWFLGAARIAREHAHHVLAALLDLQTLLKGSKPNDIPRMKHYLPQLEKLNDFIAQNKATIFSDQPITTTTELVDALIKIYRIPTEAEPVAAKENRQPTQGTDHSSAATESDAALALMCQLAEISEQPSVRRRLNFTNEDHMPPLQRSGGFVPASALIKPESVARSSATHPLRRNGNREVTLQLNKLVAALTPARLATTPQTKRNLDDYDDARQVKRAKTS